MKVRVFADAQGTGRAVAREVAGQLRKKPGSVLSFATGHTMIPVYGELVRLHEEEGLSFGRAVTFNLDEYAGLGADDHDSFHWFMTHRLMSQVDLPPGSFNIPDGKAPDLAAECEAYERKIRRAGGVDLQILGLGRNGHIGFNEPGSPPDSRTRVVSLSDETRLVNADDFRMIERTPARAITVGIATILEAGKIILVVTGWEKAEILCRVLTSKPDPAIPAGFLNAHPDVTLMADHQAVESYLENMGEAGITFHIKTPGDGK